jgi:hypothetical protein
MVDFMGLLIGWPTSSSLARPIFYGITGQNARIKVMRAMLERSAHNARKGSEFDLIITDFAALNDRRNKYVHGLWYTFEDGTVWLSESAVNALHFLEWRVVQIDEIDGALAEMGALLRRIDNLIMAEMKALVPAPPQPSGPDEGP